MIAWKSRLLLRPVGRLVAENFARQTFQVAAGLFERLRHALDQRFHEPEHDLLAADAGYGAGFCTRVA